MEHNPLRRDDAAAVACTRALQSSKYERSAAARVDPGPPHPAHPGERALKHLYTIGVYDWDLGSFLAELLSVDVRRLIDVRQRRGVRGARYAWANSARLQDALAEVGIGYSHHLELAPTTELRRLQYAEDARQRVGKRSRVRLAAAYAERYTREILDPAPLESLLAELPEAGAATLLCVERDPEACHRSLIAARIAERHPEVSVEHLLPG